MNLTAGAPLDLIVSRLERAGWGDLRGADVRGVRAVLGALGRVLPRHSGAGTVTVDQIAAAAGYTDRWTRRCLWVLEDLGLLTWRRGGITDGTRDPSYMRVDKRALVLLVEIARGMRDADLERLRIAFLERLAKIRTGTIPPRGRRLRRSVHAELNTDLPTPYGVEDRGTAARPPRGAPRGAPQTPTEAGWSDPGGDRVAGMAAVRAAFRASRRAG